MHKPFFLLLIFFSCTLSEEKKARQLSSKPDTTIIVTNNAYSAASDTSNSIPLPAVKKIRTPDGIYQTILPLNDKIEQTIAFSNDLTYHLQEKYINAGKDSVVNIKGTWTPSDGFIWLYKDQIVRGRYKWKGDTLQYYSPLLKKKFSMRHLKDAMQNAAWRNKGKEGIILSGKGNEPFWNLELDKKDSLSFLLPGWDHPLKMKVDSSFNNNDTLGFVSKEDTVHILVTVFPHFCSDGMSDFIYRNKLKVQYNEKMYKGCGIIYRK